MMAESENPNQPASTEATGAAEVEPPTIEEGLEVTAQPVPATATAPLRVGWIAGEETFTHIGRILHPLAIGLMDELVSPTIFIPEHSDQSEIPDLPIGMVRYSPLQWFIFKTRTMSLLAAEAENRQISMLHALDASAEPLTRQLAQAWNMPYVVSCYSLGDAKRLGTVSGSCRAVLAATEPVRQELVSARSAPEEIIKLVRPGVYLVNHPTCFSDEQKSMTIVAGGRLDDFVAYEALLRAFNELHSRNCDCAFFIIGNGKAEARIRQASEKMDMRSRVTFVDRQPATQLQGILKSADIYISPADSPQMDLVSLLAMAAGDPVIAARSQVDDFLIDGRTALLFSKGNYMELTQKLLGVLDDKQSATNLANGALDYLRQNHSAAGMVAAVTQIYHTAVQSARLETIAAR
jgi:glycosyltransferase involved in cell wall biosynthesis